MNNWLEFKQTLGYKSEKIETLTGYSRQGLHQAFNAMRKGKEPTKQFKVCVNAAINNRLKEETEAYNAKMEELKKLQSKYI